MRFILMTALAAMAGGSAFASSITTIGGVQASTTSIVEVDCHDCPPLMPKEARSGYKVPVLEPGTQKTEIVDVDGEKRLIRTEAWLGGSPVVYVSKLPMLMTDAKALVNAPASRDGIDTDAKTSAVVPDAEPKPLALDSFEMRNR